MPTTGDDAPDYAERIAAHADRHRSAWQETVADVEALAADLEDAGWSATTLAAADTAPEAPGAGDTDRFGLSYVLPDNDAPAFRDAYEGRSYPQYDVYRNEVEGRVFLVTQLLDPDTRTAILLAGHYLLLNARGLVSAAKDRGETYTHVQTLDGTHLGSFRHDDPSKFVPHYDRFEDRFDDARVDAGD